jgi:hypothetical protein
MHRKYESLKKYVEHMNFWHQLLDDHETDKYEYPVKSQTTADAIFKELEADLSPENLHCDGEISREEASKKLKKLLAIGKSLQWAGFGINVDSELGSYMAYSDR